MKNDISELDVVKVVALLEQERIISGSEGICRQPQVGDLATIVHVLEPGRAYIAEAVAASGYTLWVADFLAEELSLEVKYGAHT